MSAVSENIVREFFEQQGCFVRQQRKFVGKEDDEIDFLVINPRFQASPEPLPFELDTTDVERLDRAVVSVRGWHTETFTPGLLAATPELFRFVEADALRQAGQLFGEGNAPLRIMAVPGLPPDRDSREQSTALLRSRGIDAVLPFRVMLGALLNGVETNRNYQKSDLLQILRLLKLYGFTRDAQLELFGMDRRRLAVRPRKK
ncbi:MAG TPA: hypothetical protein VMF06_19540 [Candidatus Limnocylindria bacterium]|nr:hypothetical protein [Candidatus Limnocylindria bacterium]